MKKQKLSKYVMTALLAVFGLTLSLTQPAAAEGRVVHLKPEFAERYQSGTVVINTKNRELFYVIGDGRAIRYPIAVPKHGREWSGTAHVVQMMSWPDWQPPEVVRRDHPNLPAVVPSGSPDNPLGAAAILLDHYDLGQAAIHGTGPKIRHTIGTAASYGCIRMYNEDVLDLYRYVGIGTLVVKLP